MKKIVCDICGKEIYNTRPVKEHTFNISSYGKKWDVCDKCREEFNEWIKKRKAESEVKK